VRIAAIALSLLCFADVGESLLEPLLSRISMP